MLLQPSRLLLLGLAACCMALQPVSAQEFRLAEEVAIPEAAAADQGITITEDGSAEIVTVTGEQATPGQVRGSAPVGAWNGRGEEPLYDNGPLVNCPGCVGGIDASRLQTSLQMNTLGANHAPSGAGDHFRIADDFFVPEEGWLIQTIEFFAYQTGSDENSTFTEVNLQIWDGLPGSPGAEVVFGDIVTNRMIGTQWAEIYRDSETNPGLTNRPIMVQTVLVGTILEEGQYWLDWQSDGSVASGPWIPPITIDGECTTGDAWQLVSDGWQPWIDSGDSACAQGAPFIIYGEKIVGGETGPIAETVMLEQAYPNPVVGSTTLNFSLPQAANVSLGVYDVLGRQVAVAASGEFEAGQHSVTFDGASVAAGIYVVRLSTGDQAVTRRITVVR